jgi:hypothetical protein
MTGAIAGCFLFAVGQKYQYAAPAGYTAFVGLVAYRGLFPFTFDTVAQPFQWIPFAIVLLTKSFYACTCIWILGRTRIGLPVATLAVTVVLAGTEVAQKGLPGRKPDITDPLLALLAGSALTLLRREFRSGDSPRTAPPRNEHSCG